MADKNPKSTPTVLFIVMAVLLLMTSVILYSFLPDRTLTINDQRVNIMVVADSEARSKGLSGRERLGDNEGMLFAFDSPSMYCFWMHDMKFPIDIIWLDSDKKVVSIKHNATPESYPESFCPTDEAQYVLEVASGKADQWSIEVGDQAQFRR